jgi:hypothetical protein
VHILPESKKSYPVKLECAMEGGGKDGTRELCINAKVREQSRARECVGFLE